MSYYIGILISEFFFFYDYRIGRRKRSQFFPYLGLICLILLICLRFDLGPDYSQYYTNYQKAIYRGDELTYEPLNNLWFNFLRILNSPHTIIASYGLATVLLVFNCIKKNTSDIYIGILTYTALFYLSAFSTIRQGFALGIVLSAYPYLKTNSLVKYFSFCLIATLFHYSAFISFIFPILYNCRIKYLIWILGFSILFFYIGINYISRIPFLNKYSVYLDVLHNFGGGNIQKFVFWIIIIGLWIIGGYKSFENRRLLVLCTFGCIFPMLLGGHLGGRLAQYLYIFLCLAVPRILKYKHKAYKIIYILLLNIWFVAYAYTATDGEYSKSYIPYQSIFDVNLEMPIFKQ